jgi:hypothetical protein
MPCPRAKYRDRCRAVIYHQINHEIGRVGMRPLANGHGLLRGALVVG